MDTSAPDRHAQSEQIPLPGIPTGLQALPPAQHFGTGFELLRQGEHPPYVYFLEEGIVKCWHLTSEGRQVSTRLRLPGSILGSECTILGATSLLTATPLLPSRLRKLPAREFLRRIQKDLCLSSRVHEIHARELHDHIFHAAASIVSSGKERLESILANLVQTEVPQRKGRCIRVHLPLKHSEIAELIEVTPEHFSRLLKKLEKEKIISRRNGWIYIRKPDALRTDPHPAIPFEPIRQFEGWS